MQCQYRSSVYRSRHKSELNQTSPWGCVCLTLICCCSLLRVLTSSLLFLLAWSSWISISFRSDSIFFFSLKASARPLDSASRLACSDSTARWWFFLKTAAPVNSSARYRNHFFILLSFRADTVKTLWFQTLLLSHEFSDQCLLWPEPTPAGLGPPSLPQP